MRPIHGIFKTATVFALTLVFLAVLIGGSMAATRKDLAKSSNTFGFKLFEQLRQQQSGENVFISPASIVLAFAMVYNGADGATRAQMDSALAFQGMSAEDVNQAAKELMTFLQEADTLVELAIANSVWAKPDFPFKQSFMDLTRDVYLAEARPLKEAEEINAWVAEATRDKITQIIEKIEPQTIMVLLNAIYFKGNWTLPFDEKQTGERAFTLLTGETKQHPLMEQREEFGYYEDSVQQMIKMPYGNRDYNMVVLLPRSEIDFQEYVDALTAEQWNRLWARVHSSRKGTIVLPRFEIEYDVTLNDYLKQLGMTDAFDPRQANFEYMWHRTNPDSNVFIEQARHKTYVKVNEEGTEAAAVTSVTIGLTAAMEDPKPPFEMIVDRPFVCAIVEQQTGTILFLGAIVNPEE